MPKRQLQLSIQVACTYIGTVVGAGFASGQEIYQFFGRFGYWGLCGIAIAIFLLAFLGYRLMMLGHRLRAGSFREVSHFLFGKWIGGFVNLVLILMLFGVSVAMLAGAGELVKQHMYISFDIGAIITCVVTFVTLLRGIDGLMKANTVIVPIMISFVLFATLYTLFQPGSLYNAFHSAAYLSQKHPLLGGISAIIYGALNVGLAGGVLIPLGRDIRDTAVLRRGAVYGGIALGGMLLAVMLTLLAHYPDAVDFAVPMGFVAVQMGPIVQWAFVFVLWGEIFSTLVGNVYAITTQVPFSGKFAHTVFTIILLGVAYLFSHVGFSTIISYGYTLFGWISVMLLFAILWPRHRNA